MAKRKRLEVPTETISPDLETKSMPPRARMPIADVAGDTAGRAALEEVAREMTQAESEGRVAHKIRIADIDLMHLNRDRIVFDEDEMGALIASLKDRGQQTPIEVLRAGDRYGLISGLRRLHALHALGKTEVQAFIRKPDTASDAYIAMIEENEIRAALSYFERANVAAEAAEAGVFPNVKVAISSLYSSVTSAKRSKISRFVILREALGEALTFPTAIPEKLGLALATAIEADAQFAPRLADTLRKTAPEDAAAERRVLERALKKTSGNPAPAKGRAGAAPKATRPARPEYSGEIAPGLSMTTSGGMIVISGDIVDETFVEALRDWAISHAKTSATSN